MAAGWAGLMLAFSNDRHIISLSASDLTSYSERHANSLKQPIEYGRILQLFVWPTKTSGFTIPNFTSSHILQKGSETAT